MASHGLAKYESQFLEAQQPSSQLSITTVKIPCLGPSCDSSRPIIWKCNECLQPLQFCSSDQYIYCS